MRDELAGHLRSFGDVVEAPTRFGPGRTLGYSHRKKELAHFHSGTVIDLRVPMDTA